MPKTKPAKELVEVINQVEKTVLQVQTLLKKLREMSVEKQA